MVEEPTRLARRLGLRDAVTIGLGSMLGAGVFAAVGPAADAAGSWVLLSLGLAAVVALTNATSTAQLAAVHPASGGAYLYGRARLGPAWGHLAGWGFVVGKTASGAAMALTVGAYAAPAVQRPVAVACVAGLTAVNLRGVQKTVAATRVVVVLVLATLAAVVGAAAFGGTMSSGRLLGRGDLDLLGVAEASGLLFFAFAGYARIATLGEEVRDPARTIPRAIPLALGIVLAIYATVTTVSLAAVGPAALAASPAPLVTVAEAGGFADLAPLIRAGGAVAAIGVLLSLIAGVSRTSFAMAADGELPRWLAAVHPSTRVPHHAEMAVGIGIAALVLVSDLRGVIGFSSFCVLAYYAVANAAAWTLPAADRRWPRWWSAAGLLGCASLALTLPRTSVVLGSMVLLVGAASWAIRHRAVPGRHPVGRGR